MSNALHQAIEDWHRAGLSDLPAPGEPLEFSVDASSEDESASPSSSLENRETARESSRGEVRENPQIADPYPAESTGPAPAASDMAADAKLTLLRERVRTCARCVELAAGRTQTVFGVGNPAADILFVGEAPGADEDRVGEPFVGKAGQLLDRIIIASGWRREDLYICNILRCRPPGNRNPSETEAANCREYLDGQIDTVSPKWIVCWGSVAAKNLLNVDKPIGRMRKQLFEYKSAQVLCTYHPSYLLRNPSAKKDVWADMNFLFEAMGHTPPKPAR